MFARRHWHKGITRGISCLLVISLLATTTPAAPTILVAVAALSEGLNTTQTKDETFVYIDKAGQIVLATEFFHAGEFHEGLATVYNSAIDRWGLIDKTGKVVIPVQYQGANDFSEGLALVYRSP